MLPRTVANGLDGFLVYILYSIKYSLAMGREYEKFFLNSLKFPTLLSFLLC
jgi:hypothetical protein